MASDETPDWLAKLQQGDAEGAEQLWQQYFSRLLSVAKKRMDCLPRRAFDEEDFVISAMASFVEGARAGRFPKLADETDLWRLLVTITLRKVGAQRRHFYTAKNNHGGVRGESVFIGNDDTAPLAGLAHVTGGEPTPEFAAEVNEELRRLFERLDDPLLVEIAQWKMEGFNNEEIAIKLDRNTRTVERKLALIRDCWSTANET